MSPPVYLPLLSLCFLFTCLHPCPFCWPREIKLASRFAPRCLPYVPLTLDGTCRSSYYLREFKLVRRRFPVVSRKFILLPVLLHGALHMICLAFWHPFPSCGLPLAPVGSHCLPRPPIASRLDSRCLLFGFPLPVCFLFASRVFVSIVPTK